MRARSYLVSKLVALTAAVSVVAVAAAAAADGAPSFAKDVAPILYAHCVACHRPGEIGAAQSLVSYQAAKPWAARIKQQVAARSMPPWPADPVTSMKFRNDASMSAADIATVVAWVDGGARRGDDADLPPLPAATRAWGFPGGRAPDAVLTLPKISLPANGEVPYVLQRIKVPLTRDRWIIAMQVQPGNSAVVHHMGITEVTLADGIDPDQVEAFASLARRMGVPDGSTSAVEPAVADPVNPGNYDMLGVYTPGSKFEMFAAGSAKLLKAGGNAYINFNVHYATTGTPQTDTSQLALWLQTEPPRHQLFRAPAAVSTLIANGRQLLNDDPGTKAEGTDVAIPPIPRRAANYELVGIAANTEPMTIYQLQPHAHMRGKDFKYSVVYPDGREATLLSVPHYDFHWQLAYDLEQPLALPAGSKLIVTAHFDNSVKNPHLRNLGSGELARNCGPDKEAYFRRQNQSWHEMFSPLIQYSNDAAPLAAANQVKLVQTVGCLEAGAQQRWVLRAAAEPSSTPLQSTSAAELKLMAQRSLGDHRFQLLGAEPFTPQRHDKRRVAVKGVLIGTGSDARLNVTSLQQVGETCS